MIKALLTALVLIAPSAGFACGPGGDLSLKLSRQIEAKFGLVARTVGYKCGGEGVQFNYQPPENLVPENSYFKMWNKEFSVGVVDSEAGLRAMLAQTPRQMRALIMANVRFIQDAYEAQNRYGVHVYHPNGLPLEQRVTERGMLMEAMAPHCVLSKADGELSSYKSAEPLGRLYFPIHSLEGVSQLGRVALYQKGDLRRILVSEPAVLGALKQVALDNLLALDQDAKRASYCSRGMERGSKVSWDDVLDLR